MFHLKNSKCINKNKGDIIWLLILKHAFLIIISFSYRQLLHSDVELFKIVFIIISTIFSFNKLSFDISIQGFKKLKFV